LAQAKAPIVRPISQWVEEELRLPNGPFSGERYKHHRHPASRLWFDAIGSGKWTRFAALAPTQNGKTYMCYVAPVLYHLFEIGETVVVGLPSLDMAKDKWKQDFLPVIEASRYRNLLPENGEGSRGGQVKSSITFGNGATLRFMTAGGDDKSRSAFTSRVVAITEVDGMDEASGTSREADKIEQIEGRTMAFGRMGKRVYLECTVSIEKGRIWQEFSNGTKSRIMRPCPHCGAYVCPERENLQGWEDAESEEQAAKLAYFACPKCSGRWGEAERSQAAERAVLVHRGQEVTKEGQIVGEAPQTQTLGFRWSAIDNPFATIADLGASEWMAKRSADKENAEKKQRQFIWALPHDPDVLDLNPLETSEVQARRCSTKQGIVPEGAIGVVVGVDTGKRALHWWAKAVQPAGGGSVIEYGIQPVDSAKLGTYRALKTSLGTLRKYLEQGWQTTRGTVMRPAQVWIDSGYFEHTDAVYEFCAEANAGLMPGKERYRPSKGYGEGQRLAGNYAAPNQKTRDVVYVGREFYVSRVRRNGKLLPGVLLVHINADHWKSELHQA